MISYFIRRVFPLLAVLLLTQCSGLMRPGVHTCPVFYPGTVEPVFFQLKGVSGVARQSQVMAAVEELGDQAHRNRAAGRDPLYRLARQYSPEAESVFLIGGPSAEATRRDGTTITVFVPFIKYAAPHVPEPMLVRALPEVQDYSYRLLCTRFKPVRMSELRKKNEMP